MAVRHRQVLGLRLDGQPLLLVQAGQLLQTVDVRRIELADLLVHRDRLEEETVGGVVLGDAQEVADGVLVLSGADAQVAQLVDHPHVAVVVFGELLVFRDGFGDLSGLDRFLGVGEGLGAVECHQLTRPAVVGNGRPGCITGRTPRKVDRCRGVGPKRRSAS